MDCIEPLHSYGLNVVSQIWQYCLILKCYKCLHSLFHYRTERFSGVIEEGGEEYQRGADCHTKQGQLTENTMIVLHIDLKMVLYAAAPT